MENLDQIVWTSNQCLFPIAGKSNHGTISAAQTMISQHLGQRASTSQHLGQSASSQNYTTSGPTPIYLAATPASTAIATVRRTGAEAVAEPPACFVCMEAAADTVLIECGHGGLCAGALLSIASCPWHMNGLSHFPLPQPLRPSPMTRA